MSYIGKKITPQVRGPRVHGLLAGSLAAAALASGAALAIGLQMSGDWLAGDFHQHTLYTDGSDRFADVMEENANFGLDWWANSEHGGERNRDGNGEYWDDPGVYPENPILGDEEYSGGHQEMWRWQSLRDFVFPDILDTRAAMPTKSVISGLEWNVPSHEHCSTAIYQYDGTATAISEFEYRFDESDDDTSRDGEASLASGFGPLQKTNDTKQDAIAAVAFMQALRDQGIGDAWVVPAHIERAISYSIADFRNWSNAGPDVAIGFEGAPGHQTSGDRGFSRGADGGGTYGGTGYYSAKVGGLWDALLGEGRKWWNFASSDYHGHWSRGGSDFWPGEYQKDYVFVATDTADRLQAIFDAVRSGTSWHVEGDLIDSLDFTAKGQGRETATMGQTLKVRRGERVAIRIKVRDPRGPNHCPLDMDNPSLAQIGISRPLNRPVLHHIDLIAGDVTGYVDPSDEEGYNKDTNESTRVMKTFTRRWYSDRQERLSYVFHLTAEKDMYVRLRGTNLPANVPFETDEGGNPLADSLANDNVYALLSPDELEAMLMPNVEIGTNSKLDEVAEAYADLWFYSNPIFIDVE